MRLSDARKTYIIIRLSAFRRDHATSLENWKLVRGWGCEVLEVLCSWVGPAFQEEEPGGWGRGNRTGQEGCREVVRGRFLEVDFLPMALQESSSC